MAVNIWKVTITNVSDVDISGNMTVDFSITDNVTQAVLYPQIEVSGQADQVVAIGTAKITELKRLAAQQSALKVGQTFLI